MPQLDLFDQPTKPGELLRNYLDVQGLTYFREFLAPEEQRRVLAEVETRPWLKDLKRSVQHYGYKYDYKARSVDPSMYVGPLPAFALDVAQRLLDQGVGGGNARSTHRQQVRIRPGHYCSHRLRALLQKHHCHRQPGMGI